MKISNNKVKLIVSDLDGTILPFGAKSLSHETQKYLADLAKQKIYFVLNTGNLPFMVQWVVDSISPVANHYTKYFLGNSGTIIYNFMSQQVIVEGVFNNTIVKKIIAVLKGAKVHFNVTDSSLTTIYYSHQSDADISNQHRKDSSDINNYCLLTDDVLITLTSPKIVFRANNQDTQAFNQIIEQLNAEVGKTNFQAMSWIATGADLVVPGHNKFTGILKLIDLINQENNTNITLDNVLFFGDQKNDLPVFENHKYAIAVGNAIPELQRLAYAVTDSCDADGVINFLKTLK
ncbi:HAD-IIB family hydrolase [Mesoplasma seiffertii]|uniref:HAD-IIB family hydrolase n=1 Tax=Mesoplasma seiffertii TaxID=28224 RepID=UPI00047D0C5D|nr:HAD-IIB family hydrolase [Mesoplasma seiffertii]